MLTCHSEFGKIKSIFLKRAEDAFVSEGQIASQWKSLNFLGPPELTNSRREYEKFENFLRHEIADVRFFPRDQTVSLDSIYCRDASIATDKGMIICRMGKEARAAEPEVQKKTFETANQKILGVINPPGSVEGGDVAWLDPRTLAAGLSYRTNEEGIRQLTELLRPLGVEVVTVHLPHYKGPGDVFHLMSVLSPVDRDLAVVYSPLMPVGFRKELLRRGYEFVEVPEKEFDTMGCNVLAVAPRHCVIVKGNPGTKSALEKVGCVVWEYEGTEISVKGGGGPTCLTRPVLREV